MKTRLLEQRARALRLRLLALLATAGAAGACAAAEPPYNPYYLGTEEIAKVATICQTVMGLQTGAALTDNLWPGDPDPAGSTNEFRGCTATLSSSLQRTAAARAVTRAAQDCRSQGLGYGSTELAMCVLKAAEATPPARPVQLASLTVAPFFAATTPGLSARAPVTERREQLSCAELGLDPEEPEFANCVQGLARVVSARFMEDGYRNGS